MSFELKNIREQFPILNREVHGKPLVYLDNAATTQKPQMVIDAISHVYSNYNSNIHRGVHTLSNECTQAYEGAREKITSFINAPSSSEVIFTRGATEAINLVAFSFGETCVEAGDEIIISEMEHHSNIVPWQMLATRSGLDVKVIPVTDEGELDMDAFKGLLSNRTRLVAVSQVSNALGTVNPVKEIIDLAHDSDIPVLVDGAQAVQHLAVDVQALDCDFYVFSGHKMYAPTGVGVLYGKEKWLDKMHPYQGGGEMIQSVSFERTTFNELPFKFEAGTPNFVGGIALGTAIDFINQVGVDNIYRHEDELMAYASEKLLAIDGMKFYGTSANKSSVISFLVDNIHPFDMGTMLDKMGVAVRTGHHCAQPLMSRFGIPGTVRASFAVYNSVEEVDKLVEGIIKIKQLFA